MVWYKLTCDKRMLVRRVVGNECKAVGIYAGGQVRFSGTQPTRASRRSFVVSPEYLLHHRTPVPCPVASCDVTARHMRGPEVGSYSRLVDVCIT